MGKKIGKTGMGGAGKLKEKAGKLKEEGQIKKELWGACRDRMGSVGSTQRSSLSPSSSHTAQEVRANPSQRGEGTAPPARPPQNQPQF